MVNDKFLGNVGSGLAAFGRFQAVTGAIVAVVIGIIMIVIGSFMVRDPHTESTTAIVQNMFCGPVQTTSGGAMAASNNRPSCTFVVTYNVNGQGYSSTFDDTQFAYHNGETVTVYYDPKNPLSISVNARTTRTIGWVLIGVGILIPVIAIATAVFAMKSKEGAGILGAQQFADAIF